jgi:hypothetical protein
MVTMEWLIKQEVITPKNAPKKKYKEQTKNNAS